MCTIAGYAGNRRAAPILIEMMRKEEFMDGGLSTGIATIHEGKLYTAKVTGDLDELLRTTDAANFPGTVGIIHSRTGNNLVSHAHPFTSEDGNLALVLNGTLREVICDEFRATSNAIMADFYNRGFEIKSAYDNEKATRKIPNGKGYHDTEPYALMIGDMVHGIEGKALKSAMLKATRDSLSLLPADVIVLSVHALLDDTITLGTITRPMNCGFGDGETYLATSAIAFPKEIQQRSVLAIPPTTVAQVTPEGIMISNEKIDNVSVEQPNYRTSAYIYNHMEKLLLEGGEENPWGVPNFPCYDEWRETWDEPYVECKFASPTGLLKPYATVLFECLYTFYKEGRLKSRIVEDEKGHKTLKFWLDEER